MPRPDPLPSPRNSTVRAFLRILKWLGLLSIVIAAIAVYLVARGDKTADPSFLIAVALGVGLTVLLGTGLMVLTFLSSRSGHDEEVAHTHIEGEDDE
jgi:drug/metabolite transporter (DMT)-like permease